MSGLFEGLARAAIDAVSNQNQPDQQQGSGDWASMLGQAAPDILSQIMGGALRQTPQTDYFNHTQPGVGGTDPFGALKGQLLTAVATSLITALLNGGMNQRQVKKAIPNLGTTNPDSMSPDDVASLTQWMQQNRPDALGQAAAENRDNPDVVSAILGNEALQQMVIGLGTQVLGGKLQGR